MELTDGRITLRPPVRADGPAVVASVLSCQPDLYPWLPWAVPDYSLDHVQPWIDGEIDPTAIPFVVLDPDGRHVGAIGLNAVDGENRRANLGYWIRTDAGGRGYASAATVLLAEHALTVLEIDRVEIIMSVENEPSRRVAERAGGHYEGVLRKRLLLHGRHHDAHSFSLVSPD
ncbi:MAG: GNAT family N-acetyltransferase [Actinomycetota bacterium]